MLNTRTRQILMASCFAIAPAYAFAQAQQSPPSASPPASQSAPSAQTQPGQSGAQMQQQSAQRQSAGSMKAIAAPEAGQMMSSDLRGANVYGANNENIGDIDDLLLDRQGKVVAVVIGVGGFLGIGQKNVAVPFEALEIIDQGSASASRSGTTTTTTTSGAGSTAGSSATATDRDRDRLSTGAVPGETSAERQRTTAQQAEDSARQQNQQTTARTGAQSTTRTAGVMRPERIVLRGMTKADLEAAPEFRKDGSRSDSGSGSRSGSGSGGNR